jgi:hypothetical protein
MRWSQAECAPLRQTRPMPPARVATLAETVVADVRARPEHEVNLKGAGWMWGSRFSGF